MGHAVPDTPTLHELKAYRQRLLGRLQDLNSEALEVASRLDRVNRAIRVEVLEASATTRPIEPAALLG